MDRRDFLKTVAITGAAMTIQRSEAMEILTQTINKANGDKPDLVAVMGGEPEAMFRRAISELGGMKQFVKPGQKVVVKPNIGWDKVPELAGNTNPKLITRKSSNNVLPPEPKRSPYSTIPATIGRSATKTAVSKRQQKKPEPKLCRPTWSLTTNPLTCQKDKR